MPKTQTDYLRTIIYKICCRDVSINDIYIGHTTNFTQRKQNHKSSCCNENSNNYNLYVYKFIRENGGWDNWTMIQLEEHNCKNKREAEATEHYWIEQLAAKLNSNKPHAMCKEEPQLYKHCWYEEKKDYILQKAKVHYEENKEQKLEYSKQYAIENSEHIAEKQNEYREQNKEKLAEQKKIYRETHKEEIKQMISNWCEANKEKLKEKRGEVINCDCGNQYTFGNKHRHLQSKIHIDYQNQLCGIITEPLAQISEEEKLQITKQKQKEYREKNADKIKEFKKKYNDTHKEENSIARKKYYESHKNEIIEQTKIYSQVNKDKIKESKDEWYQKNKEKILERQREMITCECGSEIRVSGKAEHNRSDKHKKHMESLNVH